LYKRKLWTYNFHIHDTGADTASMFMWPETTAGHRSSEIASCVLQYFKNAASVNTQSARRLIVYSDNCSGQNKNINSSTSRTASYYSISNITTYTRCLKHHCML